MTRDHLPPAARAAHSAMLDAWDGLVQGILQREGPAMDAKLRAEGKTPAEAAQGAQEHVTRIKATMAQERARLEAEAAAHRH
jgi:hypothetical protein